MMNSARLQATKLTVVCVILICAILIGASNAFSWFSNNKKVEATGMQVTLPDNAMVWAYDYTDGVLKDMTDFTFDNFSAGAEKTVVFLIQAHGATAESPVQIGFELSDFAVNYYGVQQFSSATGYALTSFLEPYMLASLSGGLPEMTFTAVAEGSVTAENYETRKDSLYVKVATTSEADAGRDYTQAPATYVAGTTYYTVSHYAYYADGVQVSLADDYFHFVRPVCNAILVEQKNPTAEGGVLASTTGDGTLRPMEDVKADAVTLLQTMTWEGITASPLVTTQTDTISRGVALVAEEDRFFNLNDDATPAALASFRVDSDGYYMVVLHFTWNENSMPEHDTLTRYATAGTHTATDPYMTVSMAENDNAYLFQRFRIGAVSITKESTAVSDTTATETETEVPAENGGGA